MFQLLRLIKITSFHMLLAVSIGPYFVVKLAWYQQLVDYMLTRSVHVVHDYISSESFDFIVVGAGSAGAVVAARLAEIPSVRVLLLEAGGDPNPLTYIPGANPIVLNQPLVDWQYKTEPLNNSGYAFVDQRMPWPRSRSLGGCSNINWMQYMRGNPNDFDNWAKITGDDSWRYESLLKFFRRLENYHGHWQENEALHGHGGPMHVDAITYKPALNHWLAAAEELGFQTSLDPNSYQTQGFGPFDVTQKLGVRFSIYRGYIVPNLLNPNLKIRRYAYATKIHFDATMRATGVSYLHHGVPKFAAATKEIIISCGAINSAQLLLLSGIGPEEHLRSVGIKPLVNLPVGLNLQDHVSAVGSFHMKAPLSFLAGRDLSVASIFEYLVAGTGPATADVGLGGYGFYSTPKAPPNWPDIFFILVPTGNFRDYGKMQDILAKGSLRSNLWERWFAPTEPHDSHLVYVLLARPKSRGYIKLANANPMSKPLMQPAYFSDPGNEDMEAMIDGLEFLVKMYEGTKVFQSAGAQMNPIPIPGCENYVFKSRSYFECLIRTFPQTIYHPSCTCPMGARGDPKAVLDSQLRVIGVSGLRVADASIMPAVTNANLNAPTIMIGERCADLIKSNWFQGS